MLLLAAGKDSRRAGQTSAEEGEITEHLRCQRDSQTEDSPFPVSCFNQTFPDIFEDVFVCHAVESRRPV